MKAIGSIYRTVAPPSAEEQGEEAKVVIYVPESEEDLVEVDCCNIVFRDGPLGGVNVVDPRGGRWQEDSLEHMIEVFRRFLESEHDLLQLTTPMNGWQVFIDRELAARAELFQISKAQMRKSVQLPRAPAGLALQRGLPPELMGRHPRRPG